MSFGVWSITGQNWRVEGAISDKMVYDAQIERDPFAMDYVKRWFLEHVERYCMVKQVESTEMDTSCFDINQLATRRVRTARYTDHTTYVVADTNIVS